MNLPRPCLCLITDRGRLAPDARTKRDSVLALARWVTDAFAHVDLIQLREPDLDAGALASLVRSMVDGARGSRATIVVNDRADVALAAGAGGAHLKGDGPPTARVRPLGPADWMVGRSVHAVHEVRREETASYVLFGTVFSTVSKQNDIVLQGLEGLGLAVNEARVPLLAIGGVTPERAAQCVKAGAAGVAAIGAFLPPGRDPSGMGLEAAATAFREAMIG